ncbi:hypothetical protein [Streptomyces fagopyri]|uniref:hypothetical protein n=1 Tax=Streptomyces fagopyri TaxID=2662397 RepID=UPI0033CC8EA4
MADSSPDSTNAADRRAVERIMGSPLRQEWPAGAWAVGSRVTVIRDPDWDGPWRDEFPGTVDGTGVPEPVESPRARR